MKTLSIFLISWLTVVSLYAQNTGNTVTINLNSNRYQEILVDGKTYPVTNTSTTGNTAINSVVTITDLQAGQHELQLVRVNQYNNVRRNNTRTFNLRSRYDLSITVNNDGSIALRETRNRNIGNARRYNAPMPEADFSILLQNVQNQRRANAKATAVTNAFETADNYFTTDQATQLLELVTSESKRLSLAKSVYPKITDPANFTLMYDLFDNQANRDALAEYVSSYNTNHPVYNNNRNSNYGQNNRNSNYGQPAMSDANFNILMNDVKKQWLPGAKMSALTNAFTNTNNYFTTSQAKQLIQLVSDESNRLQLAKSAYTKITDPVNFSQLYDLFSTQARKDELKNYINSYSSNSSRY
jgi:hypothetical protein